MTEKQDRQCTCNVTSRRVHETSGAVEKEYLLHILSVCLYPACRAHATWYVVTCGVSGSTIFSTLFH